MKNSTQSLLHVGVIAGLVLVAAAVLYLAHKVTTLPDEAKVTALLEERIAAASAGAGPAALTEAEIIALIEKHAGTDPGAGVSEERVRVLIEGRLTQDKKAGPASPTVRGLTKAEITSLIDARLEQLRTDLWSDEAFDARVEQSIIAFIGKQQRAERQQSGELASKVRPVGTKDHIRGNRSASVTLIEYSDFECPFCKRFHATLKQVMAEYDERVRWVYRHFPLEQLHPVKARRTALASECAAELGGNEAFWKFTDRFYEVTPSNNRTELDRVLPQIVRELGLDQGAFAECLASDRHERRIDADYRNARASGGNGTPWTVIISRSGKAYPVSGAQPEAAVKQLIDLALRD